MKGIWKFIIRNFLDLSRKFLIIIIIIFTKYIMGVKDFLKQIFSKNKSRKINKAEFLEQINQRLETANIINIYCPQCNTDLGNFSYKLLYEQKKVFCGLCDDFCNVTVNWKIRNIDDFFKGEDVIETDLSDDEIFLLLLKHTNIEQKNEQNHL